MQYRESGAIPVHGTNLICHSSTHVLDDVGSKAEDTKGGVSLYCRPIEDIRDWTYMPV